MRDEVLALVERHIGSRFRKSGDDNIVMKCPFHKGGQESHPSFSVNVEKGLFHCFTCQESGTVAQMLEKLGCSPEEVKAETASIKASMEQQRMLHAAKKYSAWVGNDPYRAPVVLSEAQIAPYLSDENGVPVVPTKLMADGFHPELLRYMEIGYDRLNDRITYPVRDIYGNLAGVVGGRQYDKQEPKYKVYQGRRRDQVTGVVTESDFGPWFADEHPDYHFRNHLYLWNFNRVYPSLFFGKEVQRLIIVEGFKACLWLLQNGYPNTVALMGSRMSEQQKNHLLRLKAEIVFFLDNNAPGREGALKGGSELMTVMDGVFVVRYPDDVPDECQPDWLSAESLAAVLSGAPTYPAYKKGLRT